MARDHLTTITALVLGLCLTGITSYSLHSGETIREQQRLEVKARHVRDAMATQIKAVTDAGRAIGWHLMAQNNADEEEFRVFAREMLTANPAVWQLRWHVQNRTQGKSAATDQPQLRYVVPQSQTPLTVASWTATPEGRRLLQISQDTGAAVANRVMSYPEQNGGSPGMDICFPVYRHISGSEHTNILTVEERRERLLGFVVGWVDLTLLMIPSLEEAERAGVAFEVFDSELPGSPPIFRSGGEVAAIASPFEVRLVVEMPVRRWEVRFVPDNHFLALTDYRVSRVALVIGVAITLLMTFLLHRQLRSRRAVERAQEMLRGITDTLPIGVFQYQISEQGKSSFRFVSYSGAEILGIWTEQESERRIHILDNLLPEDRARIEPKLREACSTGKMLIDEFRATVRGEIRWLRIGATPFHADRGTTTLNGYWQDVTESKAQEQALVDAKNKAEAATQAKSVFLANMSHELRTPLNAVLGYAQILKRAKNLTERQVYGLDIIQNSGQHLLSLLNDLLDLAKIEAGKFKLFLAPIDLPTFLRGISDMIRVRAEQKDLLFIYEAPPDLPAAIHADEQRLRQILLNLLGNAVKFTDQGQIKLGVRCLATEDSLGVLRFEISDTGVGMSDDQLKSIFQPFEQVGDTQRRISGTGLGLSISRHLTQMMGGDISVHSELGKGSSFSFDLSFRIEPNAVEVQDIHKPVAAYEGPRRTVLIVDDVAANRSLLSDLLENLGFEIRVAENGQTALARVQMTMPDIILMDIRMPVMGGLEAIRRLRGMPNVKSIPIIAISASATREDEGYSLAAGANDFLSKPIDEGRLLEAIGTHLGLVWVYEKATD
ncbi:MAG TPA: ATP-binding protein [Burkholderiales bacterium]|nr:ATP-binding protein [Burkholderiales bacterium]